MSSIKLHNIDLKYQIYNERGIKDFFVRDTKNEALDNKYIHALRNINLNLRDGDRLAIIGHNGAGKSSLLKVIAGIYPVSGQVTVDGRIASLFELATGFEMEATGWENIKLRGLMLGETPKKMSEKIQDIAEFSELKDHLNIPVKYYSSGMFIRLAFSVSTSIEPDILLLDEVVAAGDAHFLQKAQKRMNELIDRVKILVFVTHSMQSALDFCNQCIWLENGEIKLSGTTNEVIKAYNEYYNSSDNKLSEGNGNVND
ncbi:ABC transporter ATP-binding protein [Paenibacillus oceani]|uniref:ABC transporter ATP-binding protein n=1 Tax=Paenibacillus oceani TaxID=2772510 RepID=A0A927CF40_9BACL|nr:ABC transporter ATP-binding protein [Paenibacillus oceani]MBD2864806.1 ABC transporter ATP-binding protein [Paenibacillus oceani]